MSDKRKIKLETREVKAEPGDDSNERAQSNSPDAIKAFLKEMKKNQNKKGKNT